MADDAAMTRQRANAGARSMRVERARARWRERELASVRRGSAADGLRRPLKHLARVRVRNERERLVDRHPPARRDPFLTLRARGGVLRFHQKEVADLVNQLSAEAKVPVDGRRARRAATRSVSPVSSDTSRSAAASGSSSFPGAPSGIPSFDSCRESAGRADVRPRHGRPRLRPRLRGWPARASRRYLRAVGARERRSSPTSFSVARPSMNCRTTGSCVFLISSTVPTWRTRPS